MEQSTTRAIALQLMAWEFCIPLAQAVKRWSTGTPSDKGRYMDRAGVIVKVIEQGGK